MVGVQKQPLWRAVMWFGLQALLWVALTVAFAASIELADLAPRAEALAFSATNWLPWIVLAPAVFWLSRKFPLERGGLLRGIPVHLVACGLCCFAMLWVGAYFAPVQRGWRPPTGTGGGGPWERRDPIASGEIAGPPRDRWERMMTFFAERGAAQAGATVRPEAAETTESAAAAAMAGVVANAGVAKAAAPAPATSGAVAAGVGEPRAVRPPSGERRMTGRPPGERGSGERPPGERPPGEKRTKTGPGGGPGFRGAIPGGAGGPGTPLSSSGTQVSRSVMTRFWPPFSGIVLRANVSAAVYLVIACFAHAFAYYRRAREREKEALALAAGLSRAKLDALRLQLQPHFLFNTLNAISTLVHRDAAAADDLIVNLSELLRLSLQTKEHEVPLARELELLDCYLAIEQARLGERLCVVREIDPAALPVLVPTLMLQPLAENAIRHGIEPRRAAGTLVLRAELAGGSLRLTVADDGVGLQANDRTSARRGIGLSNTEERLRALHGAAAQLDIAAPASGGVEVRIVLPRRTTPAVPAGEAAGGAAGGAQPAGAAA